VTDALVVDASVAAKWVLSEDDSPRALDLLAAALHYGTELLAPSHLLSEVANAVYKRHRRGLLARDQFVSAIDALVDLPVNLSHPGAVVARAVQLALDFQLATPYDAFYLALAEQLQCDLWTADERFHATVTAQHPRVHLLAEWPA
jgi:predicted nucleic acid-binding protein